MKTVATILLLLVATSLLATGTLAGEFTKGNLVVLQIGDGSGALTGAAAPVFLRQYTPAGTFVDSIIIPSTGDSPRLIVTGSSTSEGHLVRSSEGNYITIVGYDTTAGAAAGTFAVAGVKRIIARIDASGNVDLTTAFNDGSTSAVRAAVSTDGTTTWTSTSAGGVRYKPFGSVGTSTRLSSTPVNTRVVKIFNGQLYVTSASGAFLSVCTIGTGTPTDTGQTTTVLSGMPTTGSHSPYSFSINPDGNKLYLADDGSAANDGGIQKWTFDGSTWTKAYTLFNTGSATIATRGLTVDWSGSDPMIYATTATGAPNRLIKVTDTGSGSVAETLATSPTNTVFRGVDFAPAVNSITIKKFQSTSSTDTSSATAKSWTLKLKTGGAAGTAIKTTATGTLDTTGLAGGTYYACEVDSSGWTHVGYKAGTSAAVISTDTCVQISVSGGESKTVKFWNFKASAPTTGTITVRKFRATSAEDTSSTTAKAWTLKLKTGSATGGATNTSSTGTLGPLTVAAGTYFACEADSADWTHVGYKVGTSGAVIATDTCVEVSVAVSQSRTVRFWNFKPVPIPTDTFCTYTQADWGSQSGFTFGGGGSFSGHTRDQLLEDLIPGGNSLVLGVVSNRSLTIPNGASSCIKDRLPAGGGASALPRTFGDFTLNSSDCNTTPTPLPTTHKGGFRNKLLGETIALALNVRLSNSAGFDLAGFTLPSLLCTMNGTFKFSGGGAWAAGKTVGQILGYANDGLAGLPTPRALSGIASVIGDINDAFRNCSVVLVCGAGVGDVATGDDASQEPEESFIPTAYALHQSYPNPFNPSTIIRFDIPEPSIVTLKVYNVLGQEVAVLVNGEFREAGQYDVRMDGSKLSSGVYFYRLTAGEFSEMKKMLLLK
jgi:hypothetical protein